MSSSSSSGSYATPSGDKNGVDFAVIAFMVPYLLLTLCIGLYAGRKTKTIVDFVLAGRTMPLIMTVSTMFAMFFGAETTLGASYNMASDGLKGDVIADPFGASLCLILYGVFFAAPLYMSNYLTLSDYFVCRFGPKCGVTSAIITCWGYVLWTAGQLVGLGIITSRTWGVSKELGSLISLVIVTAYTFRGGMYAVAYTEFVETIVIITCLIIVAVKVGQSTDSPWIQTYKDEGETMEPYISSYGPVKGWLNFFALWSYLAIGSIPSQDIYERMNSASRKSYAIAGAILSGIMYLGAAQIPLYLGLVVRKVYGPDAVANGDESLLLDLIETYTSKAVQVVFYAAFLSAILSTASGTLLGAGILITVNIVRPSFPHWADRDILKSSRIITIFFAALAWLVSSYMLDKISAFVNLSSVYLMVGLFFPLAAGLYWPRVTHVGAGMSMFGGLVTYTTCFICALLGPHGDGEGWELYGLDTSIYGNLAAVSMLVLGSLMPQRWQDRMDKLADLVFGHFVLCQSRAGSVIKVDESAECYTTVAAVKLAQVDKVETMDSTHAPTAVGATEEGGADGGGDPSAGTSTRRPSPSGLI